MPHRRCLTTDVVKRCWSHETRCRQDWRRVARNTGRGAQQYGAAVPGGRNHAMNSRDSALVFADGRSQERLWPTRPAGRALLFLLRGPVRPANRSCCSAMKCALRIALGTFTSLPLTGRKALPGAVARAGLLLGHGCGTWSDPVGNSHAGAWISEFSGSCDLFLLDTQAPHRASAAGAGHRVFVATALRPRVSSTIWNPRSRVARQLRSAFA
jgi:hypothetical protein